MSKGASDCGGKKPLPLDIVKKLPKSAVGKSNKDKKPSPKKK